MGTVWSSKRISRCSSAKGSAAKRDEGGDDSCHNLLVLNVYAKFELRSWHPFDERRNDPSIVLRHQTFAAGNRTAIEQNV